MPKMKPDSAQTSALLDRIDGRDRQALEQLLARGRPGLRDFVAYHLDPRLRRRLDPSDVVQDVQLEVGRRIEEFLERRPMPFHFWLRKTAYERLLNQRRDHQRARRAVEREVRLPDRSSLLMVRPPLHSSPGRQAEAREFAERISRAVAELPKNDREILTMRHAEELSFEEIGCLLEIEPAAARQRYGRALIGLQSVLSAHGLLEDRPRARHR